MNRISRLNILQGAQKRKHNETGKKREREKEMKKTLSIAVLSVFLTLVAFISSITVLPAKAPRQYLYTPRHARNLHIEKAFLTQEKML